MNVFSVLAEILFVGHSLIGPDLPRTVEAGLATMDEPATVAAQIINGAPLRHNFENGGSAEGVNAREELTKGETRVLILTEAIPLAEHLKWNDTPGLIARYATEALTANPDARIYLYETWHSRKSGPGTVIDGDPNAGLPWRERLTADLPLWEDAVLRANAALGQDAVQLLPAGQAMALLSDEVAAGQVPGISSMDAFFSDDIHLSEKGETFVALVHLAAIAGRSPEGLPPRLARAWRTRDGIIDEDLARSLQSIAWRAVDGYSAPKSAALTEPTIIQAKDVVFTPITNPNLGLGLNGLADWSVQQPFLDVMKTAREWVGHLPGQWGGWDFTKLQAEGLLDAQGWPDRVPDGLDGISTVLLTDIPPDSGGVAGRYVLTYEGRGRLVLGGRAAVQSELPGRVVFDFTPGEGGVILTIEATDPADNIRNIQIVREDRAEALARGEIFNPDWLARIRGVSLIRFMDWMKTNNSTLAEVQDRPKLDDFTWTRHGAPIEVMIALANELGADPWFTLPHLASDDLIRFYAEAVRDGLDPKLNAYVEFSNEVWNWQFAQAQWAEDQGRARWGGDSKWVQFYALRASQMADIWAKTFGPDASTRLTRVIATQTGWLGLEEQILNAPDVLAEGLPAPATHFDALAVTGYFSGLIGSDEKAKLVRAWIAESEQAATADAAAQGLTGADAQAFVMQHRFDRAVAAVLPEIIDGAVTGDPSDSLDRLLTTVLPHHAKVAEDNGLRLAMYEGGTHVVGYAAQVDDDLLTAFFTHLNYTSEMASLYARLLDEWAELTPEPFNAFVDIAAPSKWGSWGALRHLTDENPRWAVLAKGCLEC